jgi:hypothetical protein
MFTAFHPGASISTDWELFGKMPNDQLVGTCQSPLAGVIQEFVAASATECNMPQATATPKTALTKPWKCFMLPPFFANVHYTSTAQPHCTWGVLSSLRSLGGGRPHWKTALVIDSQVAQAELTEETSSDLFWHLF